MHLCKYFFSCTEVHNQFYLCILHKGSNNLTPLDFFFLFLKSIQEAVKASKTSALYQISATVLLQKLEQNN